MTEPFTSSSPRRLALWPAAAPAMAELATQLGYFGYEVVSHAALAELVAVAGDGAISGIVIDFDRVDELAESEQAALRALAQSLPMTALSSRQDIHQRLLAVRLGCQAFFARPVQLTGMLDTLDRLTNPTRAEAGKVLIVDDSPSTAAFYAAVLTQAGFLCQVVNDPLQTLEVLEAFTPELLLLDMHMPGASGEELAKVIRQQDAYLSTPIVYLSAESDLTRQWQAMSLGGDEFLQKPIQPAHLIAAVQSRIIRYRALRALMVRDSLTGLLNHTNFKERLRGEVARMKRLGKPMSVALIDIDFFKKVNDSYGHPVGDRVIKSLARLLKQRLRGADVIGRYGGEEFAVALPETAAEDAFRVLDALRGSFEAIVHAAGSHAFHTTLSAGIAAFPAWDGAEELINQADLALYAAKQGGRNRVEMASRRQP
jgi:diguanylate cyclase (GGDEF)-like protein